MKREDLRKLLRGKCVTDEACEAAIDELLDLLEMNEQDSIVRNNLMNEKGYTPYCGDNDCEKGMPRTKWDAEQEQFVCSCGWVSKIAPDLIKRYKERWLKIPGYVVHS